MSFAFYLIKGDAELSECSYLTVYEVNELNKTIVHSDWREDLILKLRENVKEIDFSDIAPYIGAELQDKLLMMKCMGRKFKVSANGEVITKGFVKRLAQ